MFRSRKNHTSQQKMFDRNLIVGLSVVALVVVALYVFLPKMRRVFRGSGSERFANGGGAGAAGPLTMKTPGSNGSQGGSAMNTTGPAARVEPHVVGSSSSLAPPAMAAPRASSGPEGFADYNSTGDIMGPVPMGASSPPQGCYPREQINPSELLPQDNNGAWAAANPQGSGDIQGKNFLSAGALTGINTVGQSLRNANRGLRAEPPCPQVRVSPWRQSTIEPDLQRRPLE